jgi:phytoene dehydrogenase-like protein
MSSVIVIGSGMGGLMCGNLLAKKGHKVTIFESHVTPGGYTAGFWRKGFYFESGTLSFESSSAVLKAMKDIGVRDKIQFTRQYGRWVSKEFDCVAHSFSDLKKALLDAFPSEKENLTRYYAEIDKMCMALRSMRKPRSIFEAITFPFKMARIMSQFNRYARMTIPEFTAMYFDKNSRLYQLLKDFGYPDMSAAILGGAVLSFFEDYWTVPTGMQSWADVLADNFKDLGGDLRLKSKIDKIITKKGAAIGVISNGKDYKADYVISSSDYKKTFLELLDNKTLIPQAFKERLQQAQVSEGFFTVYLGLNLSQEKMKEYLKIPHVFFFADKPDVDIRDSSDEDYFEKASPALYSPSLMNAKLAPEGKSSLMITVMTPYRWMNNWGGGDKETYKRLKDKAKKALIKTASTFIPELEKHIEFEDAATPLTYERYTHNTDGASSAWSWNPNKRFYKKVMDTHIKTPVKNLYIGSCWASQIGGVPGAIDAAYHCAREIK